MNRKRDRIGRSKMWLLLPCLTMAAAAVALRPAVAHAERGFATHAAASGDGFERPFLVGHFPPPGGPMLGDGPAAMLPLLLFAGDLTDAQRDQVHDIMKGNRQTIAGLFAQLRSANDELASKLLGAGSVAQSDLQPTLDRIASVRQQLVDQGVKVALQVRALLSAEQIAKAAQVHDRLQQLEEEKRKLLGREPMIIEN